MRVAILSGTYPPMRCGVGDYVGRLAPALAARGFEVHVVTSRGAGRGGRGVTVWPVVRDWSIRGVRTAVDRVVALKPDVVHFQYPTTAYGKSLGINWLPVALRRRLPGPPRVLTLHEFSLYGRAGRLRLAPNILAARAIGVTTREEAKAVAGSFPSAAARLRVIPIAPNIDTDGTRAEGLQRLRRLGVGPRDRTLLYFGWAGPNKGLPQLLEAVRRLWDRSIPVKLICASTLRPAEDPFHEELDTIMNRLEIMDRVVWTGFLPGRAVSGLFKAVELAVFPFEDGLKLNRGSFLAALAHGTPTVTTPGPGVRELGRAGLILAAPTGPALAAAIGRALAHPARGARRPPAAATRFAWPAVSSAYASLYRSVLRRGSHLTN